MRDERFARSSATAQGVDPHGLLDFVDAVERDGVELHSLMVLRHGVVVAEGWWSPYSASRRHLMYSVSKTFTACATGFAVGEGLLSLDDHVVSFFPDDLPVEVHPRIAALTVRHLLTMSTGHDEDTLTALRGVPAERWIASLLAVVPQTPVGSRHVYNNGASLLLANIVRRVSGEHLIDYLRSRLFEPLGITDATWTTDGLGRELGWSGLHVRTEDLAALGDLLLHDGVWRGVRLLPQGWVDAASVAQISTAEQEDADWAYGYGYQMWVSRHGFRADGAFGQFCLVLPEQDAVVVTTSGQPITQTILEHVWTHLIPALSEVRVPADPDAERALAGRLAALVLTPATSSTDLAAVVPETTSWVQRGPVAIAPGGADPSPWFPALSDVALVRSGTGTWTLRMVDAGHALTFACGDGRWVDSTVAHPLGATIAVSASAGCSGADACAEIVFVETPHRLRVELHAGAAGTSAQMRWNVPPLDIASLDELHA